MNKPNVVSGEKPGVGMTLFVARNFRKGEFIFRVKGPITNKPTIYSIPVDFDKYAANEIPLGKYLCHSCKPNAGIKNKLNVVTLRKIKKGEEVTIDYAMIVPKYGRELPPDQRACKCLSSDCRGELGSWHKLPDELKKKYKGFTADFINSYNSQKIKKIVGLGKDALKNQYKYNGFIGISIGNKYFSKERIRKYILFGLENFNNFLIVIGDFLARHNYMAQGLTEKEAVEKSLRYGEQYKIAYQKVIRQLGHWGYPVHMVKIIRWKELLGNEKTQEMVGVLKKHYETDKKLRNDCNKIFKKIFHRKKVNKIALNYLFEELAVLFYIALYYPGNYNIEIYPGENIVQKNIFLKKYPCLYEDLGLNNRYGHIQAEMSLD